MTDPLSVAASVAGLVSIGLQSAEYLYKFYRAYRDQHEEVARIADQLDNLLKTLRVIVDIINTRKWRADEGNLLHTIEEAVTCSEDVINDLQDEANKFMKESGGDWKKKAITIGRRAAYPFRRSTLEDLGEDVEAFRANLSIALQTLELKEHQNTQNDIEVIDTILNRVHAQNVDAGLRLWLKAPDASIDFNIAFGKKHQGTGQWLIQDPTFTAWSQQDNSFLWLHGFAGCGKSVLCSTVIQYVLRLQQQTPGAVVAFFFFTFGDESKQDASAAIRAVLIQLCGQITGLEADLTSLKRLSRDGAPSLHAMLECLRTTLIRCRHVYLVIDALDESLAGHSRLEVLRTINTMRAWKIVGLHLLVTSRDIHDIRECLNANFSLADEEQITLKNDGVQQDISNYVRYQVDHDVLLARWGEGREKIKKYLIDNAGGVFRWVECQLKPLRECPRSRRLLDKCLQTLPRDLDHTYERILSQIGEFWREDAQQVLSLLCHAPRPLTVDEVLEATAIDLGGLKTYDPMKRLESADDLQQICSGLIDFCLVDESDIDWIRELRDDNISANSAVIKVKVRVVRIAHFSVQEYLLSERIQSSHAKYFALSRHAEHARISEACLIYLSRREFIEAALCADLIEQYAFATYAAMFWHYHYKMARPHLPNCLIESVLLFLNASPARQRWFHLHNADVPWKDVNYENPAKNVPSATYWASSLGLHEVLSRLLSDSFTQVNEKGGHYGNALQAAVFTGNKHTVRMLLNAGADVNAQGGYFGTAIEVAAFEGYKENLQLLLDAGADVNIQGGEYSTALQAAVVQQHNKVVEALLDAGADVNAQGGTYKTALVAAAATGNDDAVRMLLDVGADVNAVEEYSGSTMFMIASTRANETAIRMLCERGADINARNNRGQTALIDAIIRGDRTMSRQLVHLKADSATVDFFGRTAVDWLKLHGTDDELLRSICKNTESPATFNVEEVRAGIQFYVTSILQNELKRSRGLFAALGRGLLLLGDKENASLALERRLGRLKDTRTFYHKGVICDECESSPIQGPCFICTVCPDVDLCTQCMKIHREDWYVTTCRNHEFWEFSPIGVVMRDAEAIKIWLQAVADKYSKSSTVLPERPSTV